MLTAKDIDPSLMSQEDIAWMKNIPKSIEEGVIRSARQIQTENQPLGEDDQKFQSGFKSQGVTRIKKFTGIVLKNESGKPEVFEVKTGSEVLAANDAHEQGGQVDADHSPLMPSFDEDDSRSFELLALAAQEENIDVRFYERVKKLHNDGAKIRVHKENKVHESELGHFISLEKVLKTSVEKVLRISFLAVLFCKKLLASRKRSLFLSMVGLTLASSLLRPSNL